jgi:hypothetical protein
VNTIKIASVFIDSLTRSWWKFVVVAVANFASFKILFALEAAFKEITGKPVFDTQNELTEALLRQELPLYRDEALGAYWRFAAFDFIFPLAALFLAVLWALFLRLSKGPWSMLWKTWPIPLFAFCVTLFDYGENIGLIATIASAPNAPQWAILMALTFKKLKLLGLALSGALTLLLALNALAGFLYVKWWAR